MTVTVDPRTVKQEIPPFGILLGSYSSDNGHATAQLFRDGKLLKAYLAYKKGLAPEAITDNYRADLEQIAQDRGLVLELWHVAK